MQPPKTILITSISLTLIGLLFLGISSLTESLNTTGDPYYFFKKQLIWVVIGIVGFFFGKFININLLHRYSFYLYLASIILLALVLIPGLGNQALGARRWLDLGFIGVQPSEIAKMLCLIFFTAYFTTEKIKLKTFLLFLVIPVTLIILEPNLSTAVLFTATILSLYYLAGGDTLNLLIISLFGIAAGYILTVSTPYRQARLQSLLNPDSSQTESYHTNQLILTLASGGISGKGFANSTQKYRYLPKISTDSILAVIGEEIGFIGTFIIVCLYILLISALMKLGSVATNSFFGLLVIGIALIISFQTIINISAVVALIPLTGVPLPFISYGGSSLITLFFAIGITQNKQYTRNLVYSNNHDSEKDSSDRKPSHSGHRSHQKS